MARLDSLKWLNNNNLFRSAFVNMCLGKELSEKENTFLLSSAILLIKEYIQDKRLTRRFELGYFIVLKYCLNNDDFTPLLDLSTNVGFYPITKFIFDKNLVEIDSIQLLSVNEQLLAFSEGDITETYLQRKYKKDILSSESSDMCYIAPTSFGKSSLIIEIVRRLHNRKIAIIVPTKSLLTQTYRMISDSFEKAKVIFHDEMYAGEKAFIAVFTQERALRMLKNHSVIFDALVIDEAHNLFHDDFRAVLLTRLIRKSKNLNRHLKTYYFSPLISDSRNLRVSCEQQIVEKNIDLTIKEPEIKEFRLDGEVYLYNRFLDDFIKLNSSNYGFESYILQNLSSKNFIYLNRPVHAQKLAKLLADKLANKFDNELKNLAETISNNVHDDFYCVDYVKKGVMYIHGKMPDLVKEYLEHKFKVTSQLNIIIANKVILEGVNLPIDKIFIMDTYGIQGKELINLIGRVNRLNEIFDRQTGSLDKLIPQIHFVSSEQFSKSNMTNKISKLKARVFDDEIKNPTLLDFNIQKYQDALNVGADTPDKIRVARNKLQKITGIIERENFVVVEQEDYKNKVKSEFIELKIFEIYENSDLVFEYLYDKIQNFKKSHVEKDREIIDVIYSVFIQGFESDINSASFLRLQYQSIRRFYASFVRNLHVLTLKEHINATVRYFYKIQDTPFGKSYFFGNSFGEQPKAGTESKQKQYVDLSQKSHKELVNLALIKIKMESDYISYTLNDFVNFLLSVKIISEDEYNKFIYGTANKKNTEYSKLGLSGSLINRLEKDNQLENIQLNKYGHVEVNTQFKEYINSQDDLIKFEVSKYIPITL